MSILRFSDVFLSYGDHGIFQNFSLEVFNGQKVAVMGASGSGKTTLLRLAAGLLEPDSGSVQRSARRISVSFQEPRLLPHLTVLQNVSLVLNGADSDIRAEYFLELTGLEDSLNKTPSELSGGMQKRVSLARSLAYGGDLYLLDEPLSSLDEETSMKMVDVIKKCTNGSAVILVTHSREMAETFTKDIIYIK